MHIKVTMNYIGKWLVGAGLVGLALPVQAQPIDSTLICYMQLPNQSIVNLVKLCGRRHAPTRPHSSDRQAQFLQDFAQQVQLYPQGADILAQADPDALIGKANLVCQALRRGSYKPTLPDNSADQPLFRQQADVAAIVIEQVAQQAYCLQ